MTQLIENLKEWQELRNSPRFRSKKTGFIPTMGALHAGHMQLVARAAEENDITVTSIFVNPTQFDNPLDLEKYPRTLEQDFESLKTASVDYVLHPSAAAMYPDQGRYRVDETELSQVLCGAHRPGHFSGMLTVVLKLLSLVRADRAYFGEKDFQ